MTKECRLVVECWIIVLVLCCLELDVIFNVLECVQVVGVLYIMLVLMEEDEKGCLGERHIRQ